MFSEFFCSSGSGVFVWSVCSYPHVLDGAAEGVCDGSIMDGLLTEAKISQLDVPWPRRDQYNHLDVIIAYGY